MDEPTGTDVTMAEKRPLPARIIAWALSLRLVRAYLRYSEHRGAMLADSVTYRTLFSVFAGVLLGFSVAALWLAGNPQAWGALLDAVDNVIPGLIGEDGLIDPDDLTEPIALSFTGALSLIGLVGAAIGAIGSLRTAIRTIADRLHDDTMFLWVMLRNLGLAVLIGVGLGAAAAATIIGNAGVDLVADLTGIDRASVVLQILSSGVALLVTFLLDAGVLALLFLALSGIRPPAKVLWIGAIFGAIGLTVLQQLSSLFVGGASSNPLLASFASLIALLLWINLSSQVILIASSYIITGAEEAADRVRAAHGATTFAERRVQQAEDAVHAATDELRAARDALAEERG